MYWALNKKMDRQASRQLTSVTISNGNARETKALSSPAMTGMITSKSLTSFISDTVSRRFSFGGSGRP